MKLIDIYYFKGWTKKERREFWLSFLLTILVLVLVYLFIVITH